MARLTQDEPESNSSPFQKAERFNYQPTTKEAQDRLSGMFLTGAGRYPGVPLDPKTQEEKVMYRLGRGDGGPVELPAIQQDEHGAGFISQFTARVHALKNRYGFRIKNRVDYSTNPVRSWYWVEINENGFPVLDSVPIVGRKISHISTKNVSSSTAAPTKPTSQTPQATPAQATMFATFISYETGSTR